MPDNELEQEFIFVKPEYVDHWSYQIDNGKRHLVKEEQVYPYIKTFLKDSREWAKVVDIITRHQPFIVSVKNKTCKELHLSPETRDFHRGAINRDLAAVTQGFEGEGAKIGFTNKYLSRSSSRQEDSLDRALRRYVRNTQNSELSDVITQRRLK